MQFAKGIHSRCCLAGWCFALSGLGRDKDLIISFTTILSAAFFIISVDGEFLARSRCSFAFCICLSSSFHLHSYADHLSSCLMYNSSGEALYSPPHLVNTLAVTLICTIQSSFFCIAECSFPSAVRFCV